METGNRHIDIEELFRQKLENAEVIPESSVNTQLMRKLSGKEFLRFNPARFNIYYLGLITAGLITAGVLLFSGDPKDDNNSQDSPPQVETSEVVGLPAEGEVKNVRKEETGAKTSLQPEAGTVETDQKTVESSVTETREGDVIVPTIISGSASKDIVISEKSGSDRLQAKSAGVSALFLPSAISGCAPLKIHFDNLADSYIKYNWTFGDGGFSGEKEPDWIYDVEGEYIAILKVTDSEGKTTSWSVPISVYPRPKAKFEFTPDNAVLPIDEIRFINYSTGAAGYKWDFGDGGASTAFEPVHKYLKYGRYDIRLVAISENGCSDTLIIKNAFSGSDYSIKMPNAFIPNSQGPSGGLYSSKSDENAEIFHPVYSGVTEYRLKIFSKTGILIFESNDINIGWDGYFKGQLCNPGVYIWKVSGNFSNGEPFTKMGDVTLLKN